MLLELLGPRCNDRYEAALAALREDTRDLWADMLARDSDELERGEEPATADEAGLSRFLEGKVMPWFETRRKELANRPADRRPGIRRGTRPRQARKAGPLRGTSRPQARTHARHAAAAQGPAAGDGYRLIRLAK